METQKEHQDSHPLENIDKTIHSPTRLRILLALYVVDEADFTFLLGQTKLTGGNLSANLMHLEKEEIVSIDKRFQEKRPQTVVSLTPKGREAFKTYRKQMLEVLG